MQLDENHKKAISRAYQTSIKYNAETILTGKVLVVDPSSGGSTSLPALTILDKGKIIESVEVDISAKYRVRGAYVGHRLREIGAFLIDNYGKEHFDLLAIELIYELPSSNTVMKSFNNLTMSIGAIHACIDAEYRLVVPPWEWHTLRNASYEKSDLADSRLMAKALIRDAKAFRKSMKVPK